MAQQPLRDPDRPLSVSIVVYDLLPPSRFGSFLNVVGSGVYHSSVQLSLPLGPTDTEPTPSEYAFGGHDEPGATGIFAVPAGTAVKHMPGLRHYRTIEVGPAFGPDWKKAFDPSTRSSSTTPRLAGSSPSASSWATSSRDPSSTSTKGQSALPSKSQADRAGQESLADYPGGEDDGGNADGTYYMTPAERRADRILREMRQDPAWHGTQYRLLERNCNHFTDELVWRLTGRRPPAWLNRAAWVATTLPWVVPAGWIDDSEQAAPTASVADPAHLVSRNDSVAIAPPRAHQGSLGGSRV